MIKKQSRVLEQEHINFLLSQETLIKHAGLTLQERAKMFHRRFPNKIISPMTICRLFKANKITMKKYKRVKVYSPYQRDKQTRSTEDVMKQLKSMKEEKRKMIYIDEICFTKRTIATHTYSNVD